MTYLQILYRVQDRALQRGDATAWNDAAHLIRRELERLATLPA